LHGDKINTIERIDRVTVAHYTGVLSE